MRLAVVGCLIFAILHAGCAEQRQAIARLTPWKTNDPPAEKLPRWVKWEDSEYAHPWLTAAGMVAVGVLFVAGALAYAYLENRYPQDSHSP